jgi:hypothetical protein
MHATRLKTRTGTILALGALFGILPWLTTGQAAKPTRKAAFNATIPNVSTDPTIKYDYDIVYVRTLRKGNDPHSSRWPDFPLDGMAPGQNLAGKLKVKSRGVWEWTLARPLMDLPRGKLTVSVKDRQGNLTRIERTFTVKDRRQPLK